MKGSILSRCRKVFAQFKSDPCGKRFQNLYQKSRKLKPAIRVGLGGLGLLLGLAGLALGLIPGVPGIVLGAIGFALVAAQFKPVASGADHAEEWGRAQWKKLRSRYRQFTVKTGMKPRPAPKRRRPEKKQHKTKVPAVV